MQLEQNKAITYHFMETIKLWTARVKHTVRRMARDKTDDG